jgi:hypothetical protein
MFLIFCMVMDISQFAGISAFAKADTGGIISSFQKLPSSVSSQTAALGTFQSGLNLPDTLTVTVRLEPETAKSKPVSNSGGNQDESSSAVLSDTASNAGGRQQDTEPESAVPSESMAASSAVCPDAASDAGDRQEDTEPESAALSESMAASPANTGDTQPDSSAKAAVSDAVTREIPVTWVSSPDYDGDTAGKYEFTPVLPDGYSLGDGVELPEITVTVEKSAGTITAFGKFTDSVRWQRTDSPELPTSVKGIVGGKSVDIPVAWQADHDFDIASPEKGLYVFTAQPDGYSIKDGVEPPRIAVYVPVFSGLMSMLLSSVMSSKADLSIETAAQLSELAVLVNDGKLESFITGSSSGTVSVALENDLDLSGYGEGYNGGKGWTPIGEHVDGKNDIPFKGKFDGGNHTVIGMYINDSSLVGAGLFGAVSGTVENLELSDINVTGNKYVGGVAGCVSGGTVQNCCVTGTVASPVSDKHYYVGGVAGRVNDGTVQNCCVTGTVTGYSEIGGVVGFTKTNNAVQKCYAAGTVNGEDKVGGVVGYADSPMQNCYAANTVRGNDSVGGVAGFVESDKTIKYCYSTGTVSGSNSVGGVVGYANGMEGGKLQNCTALNPSVSGSGAGRVDGCSFVSKIIYSGNYAWSGMAGGGNNKTANGRAAGYMKNSSTMENCSSACTVSGSYHVGVIAGYADNGTVQNCYSTGTVSGRYDVGGIVGGVGSSTVQNCYSTSTVSSPVLIGGIVGGVYRFSTVQYCAALNRSFSGNNNLGRVAGKLDSGTLFGNYAWSGMAGGGNNKTANGRDGADAGASKIQNTSFWTNTLGFDGCVWTIEDNKLPVLKNVSGEQDGSIPVYILTSSSQPFLGNGTTNDPYQISSAEQLAELANLVNAANSTYNLATYKLTCNLDLSAYGKNYNGGKGWVPIGRYSNTNNIPFQGTFDGGGHTVSGLYIDDSTLDGAGLFGCIDNGTVKNCRFTGAVSGRDCVGSATGYILGYTYQGRVYESTVENCSSACTINGRSQVGGMVGWEGGSTLQNCYSTGTVKGSDQVGGMVGHLNEGTMQNCYTTSTVSGNSNVGGVAGLMQLGLVKNCTALNPSVSGSSNLGRVAGQNSYDLGTLFGNYAWSGMTVNGKSVSSSNADSINGADASPEMILSETAFWTNTLKFSSDDWTIAANRLPVLKSIFGTQSGAPGLYLMPQNITYASLTKTQFTYNGALQKPGVKFGDITLTEGKDYSIKITSTDDSGDGTSAGINAGKVTITHNNGKLYHCACVHNRRNCKAQPCFFHL